MPHMASVYHFGMQLLSAVTFSVYAHPFRVCGVSDDFFMLFGGGSVERLLISVFELVDDERIFSQLQRLLSA
jgi:hypothetical protein